ncbi:hypothetical protein TrST_g11613 [Triparma strigata]|uniref:TOG domain-containing protein n=2 Tax=Triparma TaxID=722752 RepID=A0A9W7BFI1_9STRA|nr:hypothetical protein TrST_g11613 [Triparma strigata]
MGSKGPSPNMSRNSSSNSLYSLGGSRKGSRMGSKKGSSNNLQEQVRGLALKLEGVQLKTEAQMASLKLSSPSSQSETFQNLLSSSLGIEKFSMGAPKTSSSTQTRSASAYDLASAVKTLGIRSLKKQGIIKSLKEHLSHPNPVHNALEGSLLIIRGLCEVIGPGVEPFIAPLLPLILKSSSSSSGSIRDAAEDCSRTLVSVLNPHAVFMVVPVLFKAMEDNEWRVKALALSTLSDLSKSSPLEISVLLPKILPKLTPIVWDTKPQVSNLAKSTILLCCETNLNPDVKPAIPSVVNAICKPSDTVKAIEQLMHTTFIVSVDASTLSILCPVLSRALKEKLTLHKRMASIVIDNMSKLVDSPTAVAPFGPLLVPDLKRVCENVQFEEIRDVAMKALKTLTKALGHSSVEEATERYAQEMLEEQRRIEEEQKRIEDERLAIEQKAKDEEKAELEERRKFKEAMDAARRLEKMEEDKVKKAKEEEDKAKEKAKKDTKKGGKCQGCGLKKCKQSCLFYGGK